MSDSQGERIAALVTDLVAIPTHEREQEAQELVARRLTACGFTCDLQEVHPGRPNLVATRGTGGPLLCSHMDCQPPFLHEDPYRVARNGDELVGRGVLDAKGQIAALVCALEACAGPATVAITCDEEGGGTGSESLALPGRAQIQEAIVLEPTGLQPCTAQAGNLEVVVVAHGLPVHLAVPEEGVSAVEVVQASLAAVAACTFMHASHPLFPEPWWHIGRVEGGEHLWRLPGRCRGEASFALLPGVDPQAALAEASAQLDAQARSWASRGAVLRYEIPEVNEPLEMPDQLPMLDRLRGGVSRELSVSGMRSWTDAANLHQVHGLPCIVFGAGDLRSAHSDHESVRLGDLLALHDVLVRML